MYPSVRVQSLADVTLTSPQLPPQGQDVPNASNAAIILSRGVGPRLPALADGSQPLKVTLPCSSLLFALPLLICGGLQAGWLLKKRDILSGWRCRYFVVYKGRVEYYVDQV